MIRSHYLPRTRNGWIAVVLFLLLMVLVEPPVVHTLANRIEPWILGVPFLYAYLLVAYCLLIGVLLWAKGRKL
jgi:choline-glycine betaine transporter